jgi:hypothetical protein
MNDTSPTTGDSVSQDPPTDPNSRSAATELETRWGSSEHLTTLYANHFTLLGTATGEYYLVFGESPPPVALGELIEQNEAPEYLEIKPLVRVAVTPKVLQQISRITARGLKRADSIGKLDEDEE